MKLMRKRKHPPIDPEFLRSVTLPTMAEAKRQLLKKTLQHYDYNIYTAAISLDLSKSTVYRMATQWKLMKPGPVLVRRLVKA